MALVGTSLPFQGVNMPALDLRRFLSILVASEGVASSADLAVSQRAAGANMSVDVAAGEAYLQGDTIAFQGMYYVLNDAAANVAITAAHATLPRIDRVCVRVRDTAHGGAANDISFQVLAGTATSGATLVNTTGAAAVGNDHLLLANVLVPAAATSIVNANIDTTGSSNNSPLVRPLFVPAGATNPTGFIGPFAGATAPVGWVLCDGTAISRTTFAGLFGVIGTTYGAGDGSTTFNVPDLRGRAPVGKGTHTSVDVLGDNEGAALANRTPKHSTTSWPWATAAGAGSWTGAYAGGTGSSGATPNVGDTTGPNDTIAYLTLNYIIKT